MKKSIFTLALLFAGLLAIAVESGKPAPDFEARDIEGKTQKLSDYKGKVVVLEAINLDCPYSLHHYKTGAMQELQAEAAKQGAVWLLVNSVSRNSKSYRDTKAAKREMEKHNMKAAAWIDDSDGKVGKLYGMKTTPHMYVIDKNGVLVFQGAIDDRPSAEGDPRSARNYVREALNSLAAGGKPDVAQTKPYGCGIKYAN